MYCIYQIQEIASKKRYIGMCLNKYYRQRMYTHLHHNDGCHALWECVSSYGTDLTNIREKFLITKLIPHISTLKMAQFGEQYLIKYFQTITPNGFNIWRGSINGRVIGTHLSRESIQKIVNTSRARGHYLRTESQKVKTSVGLKKYYRTHSPQGCKQVLDCTTGKIYPTLKSAAESLGCKSSDISNQCAGRQKTVKGHIFKYIL